MRFRTLMSIAATAALVAAPLVAHAAEPAPPTVTIASVPGDPGLLVATASSDSAVKTVVVQVRISASDEAALQTVELKQEGDSTTWRSVEEDRLKLEPKDGGNKYQEYQMSAVATDAEGDVSPAGTPTVLKYLKQPIVVSHRVSPVEIDVLHPLMVVSGALQVLDPFTGDKAPAEGSRIQATWGSAEDPSDGAEVQDNGQYAFKVRPIDFSTAVSKLTISLKDEPGTAPLQDTPHHAPFLDQVDVTSTVAAGRVAMKTATGYVKYPAKLTMAGQVVVGTLPIPFATVQISFKGKPAGTVKTGADGRFAFISTPRYDGAYTFKWVPSDLQAPYVTTVKAGSETVSVSDRTYLAFTKPSINEEGVMHIDGKLTTSSGSRPAKATKVWVQRSANGKTGWTNVGYLPTSYYGFVKIEGWLPHASGYFRLHYYGGTGLQASSSWVYHSSRKEIRLIKLNASPEPVRKGKTVTLTGVVQKWTGSTWTSIGKGQEVQTFFRAKGASKNTNFTYLGSVRTNSAGGFTFRGKAVRDGDWSAVWFTPNPWNINAYGWVDAVDVK